MFCMFSPAYAKPPIITCFYPRYVETLPPSLIKTVTNPVSTPENQINNLASSPKKVQFAEVAHLVLIPTREEFFQAQLHDKLWSTESEMREFRKDASLEYHENKDLGLSPKKTLNFIYELDDVHPENDFSFK
jgi:hypothetical protein